MKLLTYRINQPMVKNRRMCIQFLFKELLKDDPNWHFFQDSGGITLRISKEFGVRLKKVVKGYKYGIRYAGEYNPSDDEYPDIKFLGDDLIPLFHIISVLSAKYPASVTSQFILERAAHAIINQGGQFNFIEEAMTYANLAIRRAALAGEYQGE